MHFGMYLFKQHIIDAEDLLRAYEMQDEQRMPLGVAAIEQGRLAVRDVLSILRVQSDLPNDRFGEIAIDLGLLTRRDVAELLMIQSDRQPTIGACLVELGIMTEEQVAEELAAYRRVQERGGATKVRRVVERLPAELKMQAEELVAIG